MFFPEEEGGDNVELHDWEIFDIVAPLYGWRRADGRRRFTRAGIWVPKKNGKSFICAPLSLYHLKKDNVIAPEIYIASTDRENAGNIYDVTTALAQNSPRYSKGLRFADSRKTIRFRRTRGKLRVVSSDAKYSEGLKWSAVFMDEIHVQGIKLWTALKGGAISRKEPLFVYISTSGIYDETSLGWQQWKMCKRIQSGDLDNWSHFALMYYAQEQTSDDEGEDPHLEETWKKANPSYGLVIEKDIFREIYDDYVGNPALWTNFLRYHLNIWVSSSEFWITPEEWAGCKSDYTVDDLQGYMCFGGMDLSLEEDITAFSLFFPAMDGLEKPRVLTWYWIPEKTIQKKAIESSAPYQQWVYDGWLTPTPGDWIDYDQVKKDIIAICDQFNVQEIGYDRYFASTIVQNLMEAGLHMEPHAQTAVGMNAPLCEMKRIAHRQELEHNGDPIMSWMVSNCTPRMDVRGNISIEKSPASAHGKIRRKIDGAMAMTMACSMWMQDEGSGFDMFGMEGEKDDTMS